ncbi:potassium channel family protein [Salimicrobium halophilum]|uniref:Voltage-gated potassium channel n=1 Tax=Salimicrobium halophilum TaxID=86666 RepID=A0A1G8VKV1_9BACI|nr:potassium channel family protein [Salimicrobium halophilum]SDJ66711.1 voltage-gated potassium channel [Salimicrobium halophilum]
MHYFIRRWFSKMAEVNNSTLFLSSVAVIVIFSGLIVLVEPQTFPTYFEGLWWVMTTVTTVGYGDYSPVTMEGQIVAIFLYLFGIGLIGVAIGKILEVFSSYRKKRIEGDIVFSGKDHIIIIGWSKKAKFAVEEIMDTEKGVEIVIIDDLKEAPLLKENIYYIRGDASKDDVLIKANVKKAKSVIVFAREGDFGNYMADGETLLTVSTIESIAPDVHTIAEIMDEAHIRNFKHASIDEFIISNETISTLAVRSAFRKGVSHLYSQLLSRGTGDDLFHIPLKKRWKTYEDAFNDLLDQGATLIADGSDLTINRKLKEPLPEDAELYAICDEDTFKRIAGKGARDHDKDDNGTND